MFRTAVLTLIALGWVGGSAPRMEPASVYGYVAFIDPATGERWIPEGRSGGTDGYISRVILVFSAVSNPRDTRSVIFENIGGAIMKGGWGSAMRYEVRFDFRSLTGRAGEPIAIRSDRGPLVGYNPAEWTFTDGITLEPWVSLGLGKIPLTQRATPFPELR